MTSGKLAFEEMHEGRVFPLPPMQVLEQEMVAFAEAFDPQPMHVDAEAGRASLLGARAASGWHTCAIFMRMMCEAFLLESTSQGSPGITELSWKRPVFAGDTLSGRSTVLSRRRLKSRPGMGLVTFRHEVINQHGETVMELENPILFRLSEAGGAA